MRSRAVALLAATLLVPAAAPALATTGSWGEPYQPPGETALISVRSDGSNPGGASFSGSVVLSREGRYAAFDTELPLDPDDKNGTDDVYRHDVATGETVWVSRGNAADDDPLLVTGATHPAMSDDGRFVAFQSTADIVEGDTNGYRDVYLRDLETGTLSVLSAGVQSLVWAGHSDSPHLSGDGRFVVFRSSAALVAEDTNEGCDDYLFDRENGELERVSLAHEGTQLLGQAACFLNSHGPQVSDDGRYVAFVSNSPDVTPDAKVFPTQVYIRDRVEGTTELVSRNDLGEAANYVNHRPTISSDGRFVAFISSATNLVPGDRDGSQDVFVHDRGTGRTELVSVDSVGRTSRGDGSLGLDLSDDGRYVVFTSWSELDGDDGSFETDLWRHDRLTGATERLTVDPEGNPAGGAGGMPTLSADGRYVGFSSSSGTLDPRDAPAPPEAFFDVDAFRRDLGPALGVGGIVADLHGSTVEVAGRVRFDGTLVAGQDERGGLDPPLALLGLDLIRARLVHRPERADLFLRMDLDDLPLPRPPLGACCEAGILFQQEPQAGVPGASYELHFVLAGTPYVVRIQPHQGATAGTVFPFVAAGPRIVLERCAGPCTVVADLPGAVGGVGTAVTASIPLALLSAEPGDSVTQARALTTFGADSASADAVALADLILAAPEVRVGIAPAGTPAEQVNLALGAGLDRGRATATLDTAGLPPGLYDVWLEACLANRCGAASTRVEIP